MSFNKRCFNSVNKKRCFNKYNRNKVTIFESNNYGRPVRRTVNMSEPNTLSHESAEVNQ